MYKLHTATYVSQRYTMILYYCGCIGISHKKNYHSGTWHNKELSLLALELFIVVYHILSMINNRMFIPVLLGNQIMIMKYNMLQNLGNIFFNSFRSTGVGRFAELFML